MTGPYVSKSSAAAKKRRRVRTVNPGLIGKRTTVPKRKPPPRKRAKYQGAGVLGSFGAMCTALFAATGSIFWAVGAVTTAGAGVAVAHLEYRRDLATVKRTGKPIEDPAPAARRTDDLSDRPEPQPVDLDPPQPRPAPPRRARAKPAGDHASRCTAKSQSTCRCPDGPNRRGAKTTTKRATTGAGRKK
jgi:hypothetical protein